MIIPAEGIGAREIHQAEELRKLNQKKLKLYCEARDVLRADAHKLKMLLDEAGPSCIAHEIYGLYQLLDFVKENIKDLDKVIDKVTSEFYGVIPRI